MSAAHTPGPWSVNFKKFSEVQAENGAVIAECKKLTGLVNLQANARLIAAAPDLLAALRGLDEAYCRAGTPLSPAERHEDRMRLIAARAAIAKAEGKA